MSGIAIWLLMAESTWTIERPRRLTGYIFNLRLELITCNWPRLHSSAIILKRRLYNSNNIIAHTLQSISSPFGRWSTWIIPVLYVILEMH